MRQELRVDVELADAARDQLGELAAEVEDGDDPALRGRGPVARGAVRSGRVQRRLEIGLDLGVVRCKDTVAGVGGLTVDGLALARHARSRLLAVPRPIAVSGSLPGAAPRGRGYAAARPMADRRGRTSIRAAAPFLAAAVRARRVQLRPRRRPSLRCRALADRHRGAVDRRVRRAAVARSEPIGPAGRDASRPARPNASRRTSRPRTAASRAPRVALHDGRARRRDRVLGRPVPGVRAASTRTAPSWWAARPGAPAASTSMPGESYESNVRLANWCARRSGLPAALRAASSAARRKR